MLCCWRGTLQFLYFFLGRCDILLQQVNDWKMMGFRWQGIPKFGILVRGDFMNTWEAGTIYFTCHIPGCCNISQITKVSSCFGRSSIHQLIRQNGGETFWVDEPQLKECLGNNFSNFLPPQFFCSQFEPVLAWWMSEWLYFTQMVDQLLFVSW